MAYFEFNTINIEEINKDLVLKNYQTLSITLPKILDVVSKFRDVALNDQENVKKIANVLEGKTGLSGWKEISAAGLNADINIKGSAELLRVAYNPNLNEVTEESPNLFYTGMDAIGNPDHTVFPTDIPSKAIAGISVVGGNHEYGRGLQIGATWAQGQASGLGLLYYRTLHDLNEDGTRRWTSWRLILDDTDKADLQKELSTRVTELTNAYKAADTALESKLTKQLDDTKTELNSSVSNLENKIDSDVNTTLDKAWIGGLWSNYNYYTNENLTVGQSVTAAHFYKSSSRLLKENIKDYDLPASALEYINNINVKTFNMKSDPTTPKVGFIAEDTDKIFSTPNQNVMDIDNCIGMLLKAIQELQQEIKTLKEEQGKQ